MKIIFTDHAKKRMNEREISIDNIEQTIEMPEYTVSHNNLVEAYKTIDNKVLKLVYSRKGNFIKIITLMWK